MFKPVLIIGALVAALVALIYSQQAGEPERPAPVRGRNNTALFLVNSEPGLSNVILATAAAMMENHPEIQIHVASFPALGDRLARVSELALKRAPPSARAVTFHELKSTSYADAANMAGKNLDNIPHPPASAGIARLSNDMQIWIAPWTTEDHLAVYNEIGAIIDSIDPAVVVLDTLFRPAIDITRDKNRLHALVTPNTLVDNFIADQPNGGMFWKYPA